MEHNQSLVRQSLQDPPPGFANSPPSISPKLSLGAFPGPAPQLSSGRLRALTRPIMGFPSPHPRLHRAPSSHCPRPGPRTLTRPALEPPQVVHPGSPGLSLGVLLSPCSRALAGASHLSPLDPSPSSQKPAPSGLRSSWTLETFPHRCHPRGATPAATVAAAAGKRQDWPEP